MVSLFHGDLWLTDSSAVVGTSLPVSELFLEVGRWRETETERERGCSKSLSDRLLDLGTVTNHSLVL